MRSLDVAVRYTRLSSTAAKIFSANVSCNKSFFVNATKMSWSTSFTPPSSPLINRTRGHKHKIFVQHAVTEARRRLYQVGNGTPPGRSTPPPGPSTPPPRAITLAAASNNSMLLSPRSFGSITCVTPLASPCASPPPILPASGYLGEAKTALEKAIAKRNTKASSLSIDEDMKDMCHYYSLLGSSEKDEFLHHLCTEYCTNHATVMEVVSQRPDSDQGCGGSIVRWEERLRQSLQPPHAWVVTQISRLTGGVKFLVDLRHDLLVAQSSASTSGDESAAACLKELDSSLRELLSLWFTVGLLQLARITWESSCSMLQKISEYEAVHPVRNWTDLKRRVGQYRRCFVFTHSCMPNEPLVVLHTFLTDSISGSMSNIVANPRFDSDEPTRRTDVLEEAEDANMISAAIFYSITSTQKGLQGIELGNYLIKRVVQELLAELPGLVQFSSLSPIPGFVKWLHTALAKSIRGEMRLFTEDEVSTLSELMRASKNLSPPREDSTSPSDPTDTSLPPATSSLDDPASDNAALVSRRLRQMLATNGWAHDENMKNALERPFMRLCAYYLYSEKRRGYALNSVANFHLKNGAVMWRLNYDADPSPRGQSNSCGMMVNYRYFLSEAEDNSRQYQEHQRIAADDSVKQLADQAIDVISGGQGVPGA